MDVSDLQRMLRDFSAEREWQRFNTPRNLALAMVGEVGEVAELLQWLTDAEAAAIATDPDREQLRQRAGEEISDVLAYLLLLADSLGVDVERAFTAKLAANAVKYPVHLARGTSATYTDLSDKTGLPRDEGAATP
ncbi:dCTP diphosphatase [Quadrisphaera granulorum]|uniref:dCTP diphosphatase n=1 Tax=Quadrisphaera granulorum TaxID=317664 RepID=A0A316AF95_9ACTN|nr:nucleotide pyrophosphohydrolase [Quadrisphaera granulorum]PWJ48467.1 dCTP diphosphatase [Quadrisphaera granulorum]SZE98426.1 dCTP diphosphatase [Quadrisphaera granulorum]